MNHLDGRKKQVECILKRKTPERIVYAPNYWQWFAHQKNHGLLPEEISHCGTQLELIDYLGLDVFSRNIYCNEQQYWFGGLAEEVWDGISISDNEYMDNQDKVIEKVYHTRYGDAHERLRYDFKQSTLVQEKLLIDDYENQLKIFEEILLARKWKFDEGKYRKIEAETGDKGVAVAGELHCPLKMLHFLLGTVDTTYLLMDYPDHAREFMKIHEKAQLDLVKQITAAGAPVMMSMDNLDTMFHPPEYVEKYSDSFYEKASSLCHEKGALFFIHACGRQRENLRHISSLGVDGLEGVAFPPLGDIELDDVMRLSGDRFIITGGISAMQFNALKTREQVFEYVKTLFDKMKPYANRFMFSASCNTPISASFETIKHFRDAWLEYGEL